MVECIMAKNQLYIQKYNKTKINNSMIVLTFKEFVIWCIKSNFKLILFKVYFHLQALGDN